MSSGTTEQREPRKRPMAQMDRNNLTRIVMALSRMPPPVRGLQSATVAQYVAYSRSASKAIESAQEALLNMRDEDPEGFNPLPDDAIAELERICEEARRPLDSTL